MQQYILSLLPEFCVLTILGCPIEIGFHIGSLLETSFDLFCPLQEVKQVTMKSCIKKIICKYT